MVAHTFDFASRVISERTGLPVVRVHLQPAVVRSSYRVPVTRGEVDFSFLPRWLKRALWALVDRTMLDPALAGVVPPLAPRLTRRRSRR